MEYSIDLNCDVGESFGRYRVGNDDVLIPLVSSCNIACGWHGGDPVTIEHAIATAIAHGARIGAHPSYPDRSGFGRRYMQMDRADLSAAIKYQISVIKSLAASHGGALSYVKPHGALYNRIAIDEQEAMTVYSAVKEFDPELAVMGLAGTHCEEIAGRVHIDFISEAFADRRYDDAGRLVSRNISGAVINDPISAASQAVDIVRGQLKSINGQPLQVKADSLCIHGDNQNSIEIAKKVRAALAEHQIRVGHA